MNHKLRIVTWNANGLMQRIPELELYLITDKIDICLISESHLVKSCNVKIRGYCCYHALHPTDRARGGSTIIVKDSIKHYEDSKIEHEKMQVTTISVHRDSKENLKISAIYCPPKQKIKKQDYEKFFLTLGCSFIAGGDFNAKNTFWGSRLTTTRGRELYEAGRDLNCGFHSSGVPTYWPTDTKKTPDLIDFYIGKGISVNYIHVENREDLSSDHSPVLMTISDQITMKECPPRLVTHKTKWPLFQQIIENSINLQVPIKSAQQLEEEIEILNKNIQQAAWESTPVGQTKMTIDIKYPAEVKELISTKRKARKVWQRCRTPENKTILNTLCNKLKALIKEVKNESIGRHLSNLTANKDTEYSLWKAVKGLKKPINQVPPIKQDNGTWARSPHEKVNVFAEYLEETFQPSSRQTSDENITLVQKNDRKEIKKVTLQELKNEIKYNISARKSPGYDLITGQILKELPDKAVKKILHIINAAFRLKYVPRQWKVAEVIMILKPGKMAYDKKSYRPISLLPTISKLFEKLLLKRLKPIIEERKLIPDHQFGFRERHSTIEQVHRISSIIENALENKKVCSAVFLDVAQAFDKVWHQGLEYKLHRDLPLEFYLILKSYIEERYFRVKHENEYSALKKILAGVPQGSVLGPILYLLYTGDLPLTEGTRLATFADDTAITTIGDEADIAANKLQIALNDVSCWTKKWRISLNETKSVHINFTNKRINTVRVYINRKEVPYANTVKYLGMTLDAKLKWKEHVLKKKDELNIKYRKMHWLLGRNSQLAIENKLLLYKQVLKPIWAYGIQLWGCTKKTNLKMIQTFQNKVLRNITNAPWYVRNDNLHRDLEVEYVKDVVKKYAIKHERRIHQHKNPVMRNMLEENTNNLRRLKRAKPQDLVS